MKLTPSLNRRVSRKVHNVRSLRSNLSGKYFPVGQVKWNGQLLTVFQVEGQWLTAADGIFNVPSQP